MKSFFLDLIAILAFIILSFAYFFRLISKVVSCFSMTRLPESVQDKNRKSISSVPENVRAGQTRFWRYAYLSDVSELRLDNVPERGGEGLSPLSPGLCSADFYHDAGILYPLAGVWNIGLAGRIRRSDMGILFLFLHSDTVGHIWKFVTLAYIPPTIAGVVLAYRKKYLLGGIVTTCSSPFRFSRITFR